MRAGVVSLVLLAATLVACSDDPYADYCEVVTDNQEELTRIIGEGGPDVLLRALPVFRELEDAAPSDIRDDWAIVVNGLTALETALDDADVDPATFTSDEVLDGLSDAERDRISAAAGDLTNPDSVAAFACLLYTSDAADE